MQFCRIEDQNMLFDLPVCANDAETGAGALRKGYCPALIALEWLSLREWEHDDICTINLSLWVAIPQYAKACASLDCCCAWLSIFPRFFERDHADIGVSAMLATSIIASDCCRDEIQREMPPVIFCHRHRPLKCLRPILGFDSGNPMWFAYGIDSHPSIGHFYIKPRLIDIIAPACVCYRQRYH
jgi:hypothetical protein